jgi:hypothetical protein
MSDKEKVKARRMEVGHKYLISRVPNERAVRLCILTQTKGGKGFNLLDVDSGRMLLRRNMYPSKYKEHAPTGNRYTFFMGENTVVRELERITVGKEALGVDGKWFRYMCKYKERDPDPGLCVVENLEFVRRKVSAIRIGSPHYGYYPNLDEVVLYRLVRHSGTHAEYEIVHG